MRSTSRGARGNTNPINKVAMVIGSTNGINFTIAQCLAQDGAHVAVSGRNQQKVNWAVAALQREGLGMTGILADLSLLPHVCTEAELLRGRKLNPFDNQGYYRISEELVALTETSWQVH